MRTDSIPRSAEVRQDVESEAALIQRAKKSLSASSWEVGECASLWTERWAKGRTDADFGEAVGLSADQVYQRRRVWDRWGGETDLSRNLSWTHFREALAWDNASDCLKWAYDNQATVSEMKAWRTAQSGECEVGELEVDSVDPFGDDDRFAWIDPDGDPFGEGDSGEDGGTDSDDGTETDGTDSEEEQPHRPPRNGKDGSLGPVLGGDPFLTQKAKTVKTLEAGMRAVDDANGIRKVPQHDALIKALGKMIDTVKGWK